MKITSKRERHSMDNSMKKNDLNKFEEILLFVVVTAGLLFMVVYWK
jgi:hypothetical protein